MIPFAAFLRIRPTNDYGRGLLFPYGLGCFLRLVLPVDNGILKVMHKTSRDHHLILE